MPTDATPGYAELHCLSNFSFLRGASHPEELVLEAAKLGYAAIALTDECSLAGIVRAHLAAKEGGTRLIVGAEVRLSDGPKLVLLATDRPSYGRLSALITRGRRAAEKGAYQLARADLDGDLDGCLALLIPGFGNGQVLFSNTLSENGGARETQTGAESFSQVAECFPGRAWIAFERHLGADDAAKLRSFTQLGEQSGLPLVASGDVHIHAHSRQPLQDTLTAIRLGGTLAEAGFHLFPNAERRLRSRARLARLYPRALLEETLAVAERCRFSLDELRYEYPEEIVPDGMTPAGHLRRLTETGMRQRFPGGVPAKVRALVERELG